MFASRVAPPLDSPVLIGSSWDEPAGEVTVCITLKPDVDSRQTTANSRREAILTLKELNGSNGAQNGHREPAFEKLAYYPRRARIHQRGYPLECGSFYMWWLSELPYANPD